MTHVPHPVSRVRDHAEKSLAEAGPWVVGLARAGYAAKGVVYSLVGLLAVLAAWGKGGGETTGSRGALHHLLGQPFGVVLVSLLAVGLAGYALWCFVQAIADPEYAGRDAKGMAKRVGRFIKGIVHVSLVVAAIGMVTGRSGGNDNESNIDKWTAKLMSMPLGVWLVGIAGACVVGYGAWQLVRAWRVNLDKQLSLGELPADARRPVIHVSRFGIGARGVVFAIIGVGLILAARHANPSEATGVGGALDWLAAQAYGKWLLTITAAGLIAYGFYEFVRARYRVIRAHK
jgi:hypothetical protein